ncbi:MAG TPA: hypothetical protein VHG89_05275 [Verrucomicrobiae bacterium]|nr:hypothetical protein [Verrucomicrobiae bacterium]
MKVAIITGGNRGIGKSAALNMAKRRVTGGINVQTAPFFQTINK